MIRPMSKFREGGRSLLAWAAPSGRSAWVRRALHVLVPALTLYGISGGSLHAQDAVEGEDPAAVFFPAHGFLITGYGSASYRAVFAEDDTPNNFKALMAPIFLFQISDRVLFEGEVEFELEEGVTVASLEYAQIDFDLTDNLRVTAGKSLLPFNAFGERLHPTWINPMVSPPALYGAHGGAGPTDPLIPVLSDVGVILRSTFNVGDFGYISATGFVTQGPSIEAEEEEGDAHEEEEEGDAHGEIPEVVFGENFEDNNQGKMFGGRVGFGLAPYFEVNLSAMTGEYDDTGNLRFNAFGTHVEARHRGFSVHGEWIRTKQDVPEEGEAGETDSLTRDGYWLHLSRRMDGWQPQIRWSQIFDGDVDGLTVVESGEQLALGLTYWLEASLSIKAEYLLNFEDVSVDNDRLAIQWAFGF